MNRKVAVVVPLVLAMLASACGGGGGSSGNDVASAPSPAAAPAPSPAAAPAPAPGPAPAASPWIIAATASTSRAIAVLDTGERAAAWTDAGGTLWSQRFDASGKLIGSRLAVATGTVTGIAALHSGAYVVEFSTDSAVLVQVVDGAGALSGSPSVVRTQAQVTTDLAGLRDAKLVGGAGVFALADGGFAAAYAASHSAFIPGDVPTELRAQKFDAAGSATGSPVLLADSRDLSTLAISPTAGGGVAVAGMYVCPCAISGSTSGAEFDASLQSQGSFQDANQLSGDIDTAQGVAGLANGNLFLKWAVASPGPGSQVDQVKGQIVGTSPGSGSGSQAGSSILLFPSVGPDALATALAGGGFVLTWGSSAQAFDASGKATTGVKQILSGSVAATPDGGFIVLAQVGDRLVAQQFAVGS